jgi:hypothetical protein
MALSMEQAPTSEIKVGAPATPAKLPAGGGTRARSNKLP